MEVAVEEAAAEEVVVVAVAVALTEVPTASATAASKAFHENSISLVSSLEP